MDSHATALVSIVGIVVVGWIITTLIKRIF
jgi:hypothetical protein